MRRSPAYFLPLGLALALVVACGWTQPRPLRDLANLVFDIWQRVEPRAFDPDGPVRILTVDEASLAELGQWPWPRTRIADATEKLIEAGAAAVAFDIIFSEPDRTSLDTFVASLPAGATRTALAERAAEVPSNDRVLADALAKGPTVVGTTLLTEGAPRPIPTKSGFATAGDDATPFITTYRSAAAPLAILMEAAKGIGATNWFPDRDQVIRRVPLLVRQGPSFLPSLALEALRVAEDASTIVIRASNASGESALGQVTGVNAIKIGNRQIATGANADIRPYYTPTEPMRFIPWTKFLRGEVDAKEIEGRIILVGTSAIGLGDVRATPLDPAVAGVEIQAQIVESLVANAVLSRPDWAPGAEWALAVALFLLAALALPSVPPLVSATVAVAVVAACFYGSFLAFDRARLLFDPTFPALTTILAYVIATLSLWRAERVSRKNVRNAFGKFLAPAVVDRLAANPRGLVLGGETRELTVMFSDLRNFSGLSEGLDAPTLTQFMNAYLTPMTDAILDADGTVDKYIGDAIVAFWNAPLDVRDHPAKAVTAALRMRAALAAFNETRAAERRSSGAPHVRAAMGIGLNLGPCTVGNMGSLRRFDYSVLGDTVNVASRLEGVSKTYAIDLVASDAVASRTPAFAWIELDRVRVKGRAEATTIFGLAGDEALARTSEFHRWRDAHGRMLATFRAGDADVAAEMAIALRDEAPPAWAAHYDAMAARFRDAADEPQRIEQDAVRVLQEK